MHLAQHDDVIQAVPAKRADEPLRVRVLPRGPRRRHDLLDAQDLDRPPLGAEQRPCRSDRIS